MKIKPSRWTETFLKTQMEGLTGHISHAGFPFDTVSWGGQDCKSTQEDDEPTWWFYEQTGYWLDGFTRCAILLEDQNALATAKEIIYRVFDQADEDGYLGPQIIKKNLPWHRWPHVVFFRSCMALYDATGDALILEKMTDHYLKSRVDYSQGRDVYNVEIMLWLYGKTGEKALLDYAEESYASYNKAATDDTTDRQALSDKKPYAHGVSYNEYFKLGAILYLYTKKEQYLDVSIKAYQKIDRYFMLPSGCHCSNEYLIGNDYMQSSETCNNTDYTWALSYLLKATKNSAYADKIEKCVFNAGTGAVLENFRGLQYLGCANQILADTYSNHNTYFKGESWMSYRPNPGISCCPGNVNRFMPNYLLNSWYQEENNLYLFCYAPCTMETEINKKRVIIREHTNYPFNESVDLDIQTATSFTLYLRKPAWAKTFAVKINGQSCKTDGQDGFISIAVTGNCQITVVMDSEIQTHKQQGKIWFSKGALVYSYGMKGDRQPVLDSQNPDPDFPALNIYPDQEWRYCITGMPQFIPCENAQKFDLDTPLPCLEVSAKVIENLDFTRKTKVRQCRDLAIKKYKYKTGNFVFTPRLLPNQKVVLKPDSEQKIKLYPYGACKLRMTLFNYTL